MTKQGLIEMLGREPRIGEVKILCCNRDILINSFDVDKVPYPLPEGTDNLQVAIKGPNAWYSFGIISLW